MGATYLNLARVLGGVGRCSADSEKQKRVLRMYSTLPVHSSQRESYGFLLVWSPLITGAIVGRGHRWIDLYRCVTFCLSASREVALPGFLTTGALGADRCGQTVFAVDTV